MRPKPFRLFSEFLNRFGIQAIRERVTSMTEFGFFLKAARTFLNFLDRFYHVRAVLSNEESILKQKLAKDFNALKNAASRFINSLKFDPIIRG